MSSTFDTTNSLPPGLYVVATPIGNREDLSPRADRVLRNAAVIAAEDTRTSRKLAAVAASSARIISLTEHNVLARIPSLIEAARESAVAVISDAGTPGVADPGARLVAAAHSAGVAVFAIPGPSALAAALSVSGAGAGPAVFLGFLPSQRGRRREALEGMRHSPVETVVFFESPGRIAESLADVASVFDDPRCVVCRELTKLHEETVAGRASELAAKFTAARGEFTVVVLLDPRPPEAAGEEEVREYMAEMQRAGARRSAAAAEASRRFHVDRSLAYGMWDDEGDHGDQ